MNRNTLLTLAAVTAALLLIAILVAGPGRQTGESGALLLPDLRSSLNEIDQISIVGKGGTNIASLEKEDTQWTLAERGSYPVDLGKLRQILITLADAIIIEEKTANPEFYDRLGVEDVAQAGASGHRIDLQGATVDASIIIGNSNSGTHTFVRRAGEPESWLVSGLIELADDPVTWLDRDLIDIPATNIASVTITQPDGGVLRVVQASPEQSGFEVLDLPKDRALSYEGIAGTIGGALSNLTLENVQPATGFQPNQLDPVVARFETFDGLIVEARSYQSDDSLQVIFNALVSDSATKPDATTELADALTARLAPWVYTLPAHQADQLVSRMDDLLLPIVEK